ncbi:hypothetical protein BJ508DRAFT_381701 [Ascobolus immersus RN42]|uniref:Uncharacterized protein n=1 Tax=Ascobolus immersus RN42 TaxID=1160509 RepID=A0A3N4HEX3_ASCIM|nr:hypothetical protein BJ508DRAFT_381701 [Ascobolus immersus RN42]
MPRRANTVATTTSTATSTATSAAAAPPDYGHYRRLIPRNPPDPSTGKVIKKKDPNWFANRYLIPFSSSANSIHSAKFTKIKPIPDSPPPEGEAPEFEITSEKRLLERAAKKAARERSASITPSESVSTAAERRRSKPRRASTDPGEGGSSNGEGSSRGRRNREVPAGEADDETLETPREVLVAIQKYGLTPSSAVLARLGISKELYKVFADQHVSKKLGRVN